MPNLLVTGGAGFIGANFVHYWRREHPADSIVVLDALTYAGNRMSLSSLEGKPGFSFVHGNIADQPLVGAQAVKRRGIEQGDAEIERAVEQRRPLFIARSPTISMAEIHAAEPDRRDGKGADLSGRERHAD